MLDVNQVQGVADLGNQYINHYSGPNNAAPPFAGNNSFRAVGANLIGTYAFRTGGATAATFNNMDVVAVFSTEGFTNAAGSQAVTTAGRLGLFAITPGTFNQFAPTTWGAVSGNSLASPIAVWDIKPAEAVSDPGPGAVGGGGPGVFNLTADQVNQIAVNLTVGAANQGFFLFRENGSFPNQLVGDSFYDVTGNLPIVPPGNILLDEGLITSVDERLRTGDTVNTGPISGGVGQPDFDALNIIAGQLGGFGDLGAAGTAFATDFGGLGNAGGPATDFNPSSGAGSPNTSDFVFTLGATASPGVQFTPEQVEVPEPASMLLWGAVLAGGAFCVRRRRK